MGDRLARFTIACAIATLLALLPSAPAAASDPANWHLYAVGADLAWETTDGGGVTVAVIDSGVDADHTNLVGAVLPGRSYVDAASGSEPRLLSLGGDVGGDYERAFAHSDPVGHGTAVAGIIAGRADSGRPGVAPGAEILPVRVLDDQNRYHDSSMVAAAIEWAVDNGADVVNLSLGGHYESPAFRDAIDYAAVHDVVVVACTGNQAEAGDDEQVWFPAKDDRVLAVTGTDEAGKRWPTAITGADTDLAAPGADLAAPESGGGYKTVTGTSFASAMVSGAAALVRAAHPELTAAEVRHVLTATAEASGSELGAGIVDAAAAVTADLDLLPPPPVGMRADTDTSAAWSATACALGAGLLCVTALLLRSRRPRTDSAEAHIPRNMAR